jgi:hypothetical protein
MQRVNRFYVVQVRRVFCFFCCIQLFLIASGGVFNISFADERENAATLTTGQNEVETGRKVKPEWKMPEHYPFDGFDRMGKIDSISLSDGEIVIDDRPYLISPDTLYSTPSDVNASGYFFNTGMDVGFVLASGNKIISIWLIDIKRK